MTNKQLYNMNFDEIKSHEKKASEWLIDNKKHPKFQEAKKRYNTIVAMLNNKTPFNEAVQKARDYGTGKIKFPRYVH